MVLDRIKKVNDIKQLNEEELEELQEEIRDFLVENIAKTGGHLASNLGVIELTMALHLSFDLTRDRIIWDVGHQSYTHKILTGRKSGFATLRQYGGMSGFPKTQEDPADAFNTGHSSTSISAGLGMAQARELTGDNYILASGSYFGHGLIADIEKIIEPVFGADVLFDADRNSWYDKDFFARQNYIGFGVATDGSFKDGSAIGNLYASGSILGGYNPLYEGCGAGVALMTAFSVTDSILGR